MLEFDFISRVAIGISTFLQYFIFIKILDSLKKESIKKILGYFIFINCNIRFYSYI
ncbi:hypothetical protein H477_5118 [[Clostridium] sordellii ATCC 9714]|nr:hypothetical protein H477_5118 [[Clostridium] sordellii ATCC 9714] [Paeniclostridium sordellii ATCC 9714]